MHHFVFVPAEFHEAVVGPYLCLGPLKHIDCILSSLPSTGLEGVLSLPQITDLDFYMTMVVSGTNVSLKTSAFHFG